MPAPLKGIRVIDLTRYLAGPMTAMMLGDLGADVIKVEPLPTGDAARQSGPFDDGESVYYMASNRNKRSIALDLRSPEGMQVLKELLSDADVFVENFRPGTAVSMGLGPEELLELNPGLIYASISGFGNTDAGRDLPGFDQTVQAMSGLMSVTGTEESGPMRVGIAIADAGTGAFATMGILAALLERERTGQGTVVEASLMQSMLTLINYQAQASLSLGIVPGPVGNDHPIMFPQGTFKTADGAVTIACGNEKMWRRLCDSIGLASIAEDDAYATNEQRMKNRRALRVLIEEALSHRSSAEWVEVINDGGVPCGPVLNIQEALDHPTTKALGLVQEVTHTKLGRMQILGKAVTVGDDPRRIDRHPPLFGEHTREILTELGYDEARIAALLNERAVVSSDQQHAIAQ